MAHPRLESRGIRLHPALWRRIEAEAKSIRIKPSDYLRRKIEGAFAFDPDVPNSHPHVPSTPEDFVEID